MKILNSSKKRYLAFSIVETLITIIIVGFVLVLVSVTIVTMIKTSAISAARTTTRNESDYVAQILKKNIQNSDADQIYVYAVSGRTISADGQISGVPVGFGTPLPPGSTTAGTEIHIRPAGYDKWICIAMFVENTTSGGPAPSASPTEPQKSYIVKTVSNSLVPGEDCFDSAVNPDFARYLTFLNSDEVRFNKFDIRYYLNASGNYTFIFDMEVEPVYWIAGEDSPYKSFKKQLVVSTEKLTL